MGVSCVIFKNEMYVFVHPFCKSLVFKRLQFHETIFYRRALYSG